MTASEFVLARWSGTGYFASKTLHQLPMAESTIRRFAALLPKLQRLARQLFLEASAIDATAVAVSTYVGVHVLFHSASYYLWLHLTGTCIYMGCRGMYKQVARYMF